MPQSPAALERFAIPGILGFESRPASAAPDAGLTRAVITHPHACGELYLHGAHVTAWRPAHAEREALFMSDASWFDDGKPIRGGVPICFPWFGPKADDPSAPAHGSARLQAWSIAATSQSADGVHIDLTTRVAPFRVHHRITFGRSLRMTLAVTNESADQARFEAALHTYLAVGDVRQIEIAGLEGATFIDKMDNAARKQQQGPIRFTSETDRVYLATQATCELRDPVLGRTIVVEKQNSDATVIWNPWTAKAARMPDFGDNEWPHMVCIETANVADHAVTLEPGATHDMTAILRVASSG